MELKFGQTCAGDVFVYSEGRRSAVAAHRWSPAEGARLCQDLKCGPFLSSGEVAATEPFWNASFSCSDVEAPTSIWDCEKPRSAPLEQRRQLFVRCGGETLRDVPGGR